MSETLLEVTRGELVENIHRGDIAVVGKDGKLKYYKGDLQSYILTFITKTYSGIKCIFKWCCRKI